MADPVIPRTVVETELYKAEAVLLGISVKELDEKLKDLLFVIARIPEPTCPCVLDFDSNGHNSLEHRKSAIERLGPAPAPKTSPAFPIDAGSRGR